MSDSQLDHFRLEDTRVTRRYFAKFARITRHLARVAGVMEAERRLARAEVDILARYLTGLTLTFRALAHKYHFAGRWPHAGRLTMDRVESGFPVFSELMAMANDAMQARTHLAGMPSVEALKDEMVRAIVGGLSVPTKLQFALSQRLYYEELARGGLFWARNDPQALWQSTEGDRRRFLLHWAVYDSEVNLPQIYLMDVEDTGRIGLPKDERRWPGVQQHLMAQSVSGLKLLTIARGFDTDFDDLHPKRLRRFHVGPMYSHAFTRQSGPLREVLAAARAPEGEDWALVWTEEDLLAERTEQVSQGWFGRVERQVFALDPFAGQGADTGASRTERSIILPERPFQALAELRPPGFSGVRKFVVAPSGQVLSYR
ncbi:hypothetical protein OG2516_07927 [Oceanicola granulosus HTCC2516]|uniref:Uncharacterized protein n=1 Tax=Oceanicola granulosus (strain ATCC BAA-861 / DSM 15982 / KCTC 12143 / HTCC2516) TaxID=314256 RepID=Q2CI69_OCEGH|nr:hypothetical protein [Oceanicola granulosus]EAR52389.1 hypothetical protein OG2516_07927 [Oceanicola granulosus HTCC2516]